VKNKDTNEKVSPILIQRDSKIGKKKIYFLGKRITKKKNKIVKRKNQRVKACVDR